MPEQTLLPALLAALAAGTAIGGLLAALLGRQVVRRRRAERDAAQARTDLLPLAQALRHAVEAVIVTGTDRRITWVNEAFERITGYRAAEAIGRRPGELLQFAGTDRATVAAMRAALDAAQPFVGEVLNLGRRAQPYWLHLQIHPLRDTEGRVVGHVAIESDITDRKRAEAALRESAALLDRSERLAGIGGWRWNPREGRLHSTANVPRLLGFDDGAPLRLRDGLRCLDRAGRRTLWQLAAAGGTQGADLPVTTRGGAPLWMRITVQADGDGIAGTVMDISYRHRMKAELARSNELLRGAFEAVDEGFALWGPDDRLVFCNARYRALHAAAAEFTAHGATFEDLVRAGAERGHYAAAQGREDEWVAQRLAVHQAGDRTLVQRLGDGRILRVIDRKMPDGHTVGFRVDITELVKATEAAETADRSKSEFIATISHELRTPLQVITGFSDLGRHFAQDNPTFKPMFEDIHAAGRRMLHLVNGLLDFSKFDGSTGTLALRRQPLAPLADAVVRELAPLAAERAIAFDCRVPGALQAEVEAFRFQQVLRNLLANALRFAPEGSTVHVDGIDAGADGVELTVRDHGPGIPADELESIFEPFVQSSRTRDGAGGTGLGLAISRRLMGAHGGRLHAELPADGGACFRMWLPPPLQAQDPSAPRMKLAALRSRNPTPSSEETACPEPS